MKKTTLNKKLKSYSALAVSALAASSAANAQIIYTNIADTLLDASGETYSIDLNNDATIDFTIILIRKFEGSTIGINPSGILLIVGGRCNRLWGTSNSER